jgi:hypothetical protein
VDRFRTGTACVRACVPIRFCTYVSFTHKSPPMVQLQEQSTAECESKRVVSSAGWQLEFKHGHRITYVVDNSKR